MDYKEKYEDALNRAKIINPGTADYEVAVKIFPELKESEDERIRKSLIEHIKGITSWNYFLGISKEQMLAWLENQGEKIDKLVKYREWLISETERWTEKENDKTNSNAGKHCCIGAANALISARAEFEEIFDYESWHKNVRDKVEPKFKAGDWVVYCNEDVDLITGVEETGYIINKSGGYIPFVCEDEMRLWTIEDAKDGDVLTDGKPFIFKSINVNKHSYAYCGLSVDNAFIIESEGEYGEWTWIQDIKPASKEQRDLLFRKMKEAGYEWDPKKRELKKIEQKPAWSEEDEKKRKRVVGLLEGWLSTFKETCYAEDCKCGIAWLKTLKQRMKGE